MSVSASWGGGGGFGVLVHGGAGDVPPDRIPRHIEGCRAAVERARPILEQGGSALDAVQAAVEMLEDDPHFNAGTGACLTADGRLELDAALMEGASLRAGAVCAMGPFKNPIQIARAVLEEGTHVLYAAAGAEGFARRAGFAPADPESMITAWARDKLAQALATGSVVGWAGNTVGAVARDSAGHTAAATSTGGMVGKRAGRIGDSPILGAGTYADDEAGAVSATGHGEGILRVLLAARACEALRAGGLPKDTAESVIAAMAERVGSSGGLIVVDRTGRLGLARSTRTMTWAAAWEGGGGDAGA